MRTRTLSVSALTIACACAAFAWIATTDQDHHAQDHLPGRTTSDSSARSIGPGLSPQLSTPIIVQPLTKPGHTTIELSDSLSSTPLAGVSLIEKRTSKRWHTNDQGIVAVPKFLSPKELLLLLPKEMGGHTIDNWHQKLKQTGEEWHAALDVFAMVRVYFPRVAPEASHELRVAVHALPRVHESGLPEQEWANLERVRSQAPFAFLKHVRKGGRIKLLRAVAKLDEASPMSAMAILPWSGEVVVEAILPNCSAIVERMHIQVGEKTTASFAFHSKPIVSGIVLRHGAPAPGCKVTVYCGSKYGSEEIVPRPSREALGYVMWQERGAADFNVQVSQTVTTNSTGRFSLSMPFTDNVKCVVFEKTGTAVITRAVGGRHDPCNDLILAVREHTGRKMRLIDENGAPVSNQSLRVGRMSTRSPFNTKLPDMATDDEGWFSIEHLALNKKYGAFLAGKGFTEFTAQPGGAVLIRMR